MFIKTFIKLLTICFLIFTSTTVKSQTISIKAAFDTSSILIGDQVKLKLDINQYKSVKLQFPVFGDTITGKIRVVKTFPADTIRKGDSVHIRKVYLVTSFDTGTHVIPALSVPFESGNLKDTLRYSNLQLIVKGLPVDTTKDFKDIKQTLKAPVTFKELIPYILWGTGIILAVLLIWYLIFGRKRNKLFTTYKPAEPPYIYALRELDNLRNEKLWQNGKEKIYFTKLTEIIRVYIEKRYGINALEMTSDEIISGLRNIIVEEKDSIELLRLMFSTADLVKFAKVRPLPDENEIALLNAYQFVNNTKPPIVPGSQINESQTEQNQ